MTSNLILSRGPPVVRMAPNRGSLHGQTRLDAELSNMRYEKNRLSTFSSWPTDAPVPRERLAKAGFFYRGPPFRVECFSCGGTVDDWQFNEQAMLKHQRLYPQCPFVTHRSDNVPLLEGGGGGGGGGSPIPAHDSGYSSSQSPPSSQGSAASTSPRSGFRFPLATGSSAAPAAPGAARTWDSFRLLKSERHRRRTFDAWPVDFISPDELARAGFFSLNDGDKAQCIFCRGIVGSWELGDVPMTEHSRHYPQCPFVRGCEVGNIPDDGSSDSEGELDDTLRENALLGTDEVGYRIDYRTRSVAESSPYNSSHMNVQTPLGSEQTSDLTQLGISEHHAPIHPSYATVESRLRSYQYWPPALAQKPRQLAEAGFFYAGVSDHVKCFHCDGGLRNWVPGDDPWTEHARWFSRCGFLRLVKGEDFIQDVLRHNPPQEPAAEQAPAAGETEVKRRPFSDEEVERMMEDAICKTAVELGVAREAVKRVLKQRLESTGLPFTDLSSVLAMAVDHTQATYQPPTSSSSSGTSSQGHVRATSTLSAASTMSGDSGMEDARSQDEDMDVQNEATTPEGSEVAMTSQLSSDSSQTLTNGSSSESNSGANTPKLLPGGECSAGTPVSQSGSLEEEYIRLKEQKQCKVCMDEDVGVVFLPCGHLITCVNCAPALRDCPLCRQPIRGTVRTYLS